MELCWYVKVIFLLGEVKALVYYFLHRDVELLYVSFIYGRSLSLSAED